MVEPVSVGIVVAALIAKALNRAEDGVIDGGVEVARKAIKALRDRFSGEGDGEAEQALDALVETPDSRRREEALGALLESRAAHSAQLREELTEILSAAQAAGIEIGPIEQVAEGDGNVQIAGSPNSQISLNPGTTPRSRD